MPCLSFKPQRPVSESPHCCRMCPQLLLLLLSRFSHVQLCATPETVAHQALLSTGFSRQEYWSGLPFPSPDMPPAQQHRLSIWLVPVAVRPVHPVLHRAGFTVLPACKIIQTASHLGDRPLHSRGTASLSPALPPLVHFIPERDPLWPCMPGVVLPWVVEYLCLRTCCSRPLSAWVSCAWPSLLFKAKGPSLPME